MKRLVISLFFVLSLLVMFNYFVIAEENDSNTDNSGSGSDSSGSSDDSVEVEVKSETEVKDGEVRTKEERKIKTKDGEVREKNEFRVKISEEEKRKIHQAKNRLQAGECPTGCECAGSTIKCVVNGTREMTIHAGNSGNVIIQTKMVNASTAVELYRENGTLYGKFGNETRPIKVLPDEVKTKIRERIKAKFENETINLNEEGEYEVKVKKKARLFFIIPVNENLEADVDSETGAIIVIKRPWWGFMARDEVETKNEDSKVEISGDIELSQEAIDTLNTLVKSLDGPEKVELKLKVKKQNNETSVEAEVKKGALNEAQQILFDTLLEKVRNLVENAEGDDIELEIEIESEVLKEMETEAAENITNASTEANTTANISA